MVLPSGFEPELMVPKTIVLSITPREHIFIINIFVNLSSDKG